MLVMQVKQKWILDAAFAFSEDEQEVPRVLFYASPLDNGGGQYWLACFTDPDTGIAYGLADMLMGFPELGYFNMNELSALSVNLYAYSIKDKQKTVGEYLREAEKERATSLDLSKIALEPGPFDDYLSAKDSMKGH